MTICCHFNISLNEDHNMHHYQQHISHAVVNLIGCDEFLVVLLWHNTSLSPRHYPKNTSLGGLVKLCLMTYYHSQIAGNAISEVLDFKILWGNMPPDTPSLARTFGATWRDLYFKLATPLHIPYTQCEQCSWRITLIKRKIHVEATCNCLLWPEISLDKK